MSDFRPMGVEVRHLRLVTAIVDEGTVTRAAERLNLTQSALSHQLKSIEHSLGVVLFARAGKRLVLTPAGEEFAGRARQIIADVAALEDDLRRRATGSRGTLRIATECYTIYEWLPALLKRFQRQHRGIEVQIVAAATANVGKALLNGEVDLAIVSTLSPTPSMVLHPLFRDEMLLIVAPDHPLASKRYVRSADLASERLLLYSPPEESWFYQHFFHRNARPREVAVIRLSEAILSMVRGGLGVTAAARWAVDAELRAGRLAAVQIGPQGYHRDWYAATIRQRSGETPAHIADFIALLSTAAAPVRYDESGAA